MRRTLEASVLSGLALTLTLALAFATPARAEQPAVKEWTALVFLNGHNNLDSFGALNLNQMEQVGSTADLNLVVQWASSANEKTKRLYIRKDNDTETVTSPVVQEMPRVDMGDWRNLVEFVKWGVANYPAKHYFIDMWDHGSGWHKLRLDRAQAGGAFTPSDISWDDYSNNHITTAQFGQAIDEAARVIGHKVDLLASDACLMAMAEVAAQMPDSVEIFAGSEEVEPAAGWPYDTILRRWVAKPKATAPQIAEFLADEYVKSYANTHWSATYSAFDMSKLGSFMEAMGAFGLKIQRLDANARKQVFAAAKGSISFDYPDYVDLGDFINQIDSSRAMDKGALSDIRSATQDFVIVNHATGRHANAKGVAIWVPKYKSTFDSYIDSYKALKFDQATHWSDALRVLLQDET